MKTFASALLTALALLLLPGCIADTGSTPAAGEIQGKVVGVHDGDTITVLDTDKTQHKIRLYGIDAPELHQDYGAKCYVSGYAVGELADCGMEGKGRCLAMRQCARRAGGSVRTRTCSQAG